MTLMARCTVMPGRAPHVHHRAPVRECTGWDQVTEWALQAVWAKG